MSDRRLERKSGRSTTNLGPTRHYKLLDFYSEENGQLLESLSREVHFEKWITVTAELRMDYCFGGNVNSRSKESITVT